MIGFLLSISTSAFFAFFAIAIGYSQPCGSTLSTPIPDSFHKLFAEPSFQFLRNSATDTIGLAVHVIKNSGNTEILEDQFLASLPYVNEVFAPAGLFFFVCNWEEEEGLGIFSRADVDKLNATRYQDHRLNVYLVQRILDNGEELGGFSRFPWFGSLEDRYIAIKHTGASYGELIAHEIGHFYGLLHTHETANGPEWVDRTNCRTAGDLLCDTPADPRLGTHNVHNCTYIGNALDLRGHKYAPDTDLIMSYAPYGCLERFSAEQVALVHMTADLIYHHMVSDCQGLPDIALIADTMSFSIGFPDSISIPFTITHTLSELTAIDISAYLSGIPGGEEIHIYSAQVYLSPLFPIHESKLTFLLPPGIFKGEKILRFKADAGRQVIESDERNNESILGFSLDNARFSDVLLFPNPTTDRLTLFYRNLNVTGNMLIEVFDLQGKLIMQQSGLKHNFEYYDYLDISNLQPGIYLLHLSFLNDDTHEVFTFVKSD